MIDINKIDFRKLIVFLKQDIKYLVKNFVFEKNDDESRRRFSRLVLDLIEDKYEDYKAIEGFFVINDDAMNYGLEDEMIGEVRVQPFGWDHYITIEFTIPRKK